MNYYYLYFIGIGVIVFILYATSKRYTQSQTAKYSQTLDITYARYENQAGRMIEDLLQNPNWFSPLTQKLKGETIVGIAECLEMKRVEDWVKKGAVNQVGRTLGKLTGVRLKPVTPPYSYYLVLTEKYLHYMAYEEGRCKEHLYFEQDGLQNMQWQEADYKDVLVYEGMAVPGSCQKLCFLSQEKDYAILVYNTIIRSPFQAFAADEHATMQLYAIKKAFEKLLQKPGLATV